MKFRLLYWKLLCALGLNTIDRFQKLFLVQPNVACLMCGGPYDHIHGCCADAECVSHMLAGKRLDFIPKED